MNFLKKSECNFPATTVAGNIWHTGWWCIYKVNATKYIVVIHFNDDVAEFPVRRLSSARKCIKWFLDGVSK